MSFATKFLVTVTPIGLGWMLMKALTPSTDDLIETLPAEKRRQLERQLSRQSQAIVGPQSRNNPYLQNPNAQAGAQYTGASTSELFGKMLEENINAQNRPVWDVRAPDMTKVK